MSVKIKLEQAIRKGLLGWLMHRITAILLFSVGFIHVLYRRYFTTRFGIDPLSQDVSFVLYEIMLLAGSYHALNGLKIIINEYIPASRKSVRLNITLAIIWGIVVWLGTYTLLKTFYG